MKRKKNRASARPVGVKSSPKADKQLSTAKLLLQSESAPLVDMSYADVKAKLWGNALSNYMRTVIGMMVGLVTFRVLYQTLPRDPFGFWCLLWSVFGYGILLDFGFGFAAQKRVAELSVARDWPKLSRVLSTILYFYALVAAGIALFVFLFSAHIIGWLGVPPEHHAEFRPIMTVFFAAIALAFPMGIFPEILRGQQRISLANNITSAAMLLRLGFIIAAAMLHWSFMSIMLIALFFALAPDVIAAFFALSRMPQVRLRPSLCSLGMMRETAGFSLFAYISTATNIVLGKSDQLVLGTALGIGAVALYQAGAKVAEVFAQFTKQVQDTLSPAAAHLHATGDRAALRDLLLQSLRWSVLIATPLYLLSAFYMQELLVVLTGDAAIPFETWLVGEVLLFWYYTTILTHSVSKRIFMMTGHERRLMWLGLGEAALNLLLSVVLLLWLRSVAAVAIGSLLATLIFGWGACWPWAAREAGVGARQLLRLTLLPSCISCTPLIAVLILFKQVPAIQCHNAWATLLIHGSLAGVIAALCTWRWGITERERHSLTQRFSKGRKSPPPDTSIPLFEVAL